MKPPIVLLISADPAVEVAAQDAILKIQHGLRIAHDAREALAILASNMDDFDLILLDMAKAMHAAMLLQVIGCRCREIPVVVLTNHEANYMRPIVLAHGAADCLGKPICTRDLAEITARYCAAAPPGR